MAFFPLMFWEQSRLFLWFFSYVYFGKPLQRTIFCYKIVCRFCKFWSFFTKTKSKRTLPSLVESRFLLGKLWFWYPYFGPQLLPFSPYYLGTKVPRKVLLLTKLGSCRSDLVLVRMDQDKRRSSATGSPDWTNGQWTWPLGNGCFRTQNMKKWQK